jgi:hypothetical protein
MTFLSFTSASTQHSAPFSGVLATTDCKTRNTSGWSPDCTDSPLAQKPDVTVDNNDRAPLSSRNQTSQPDDDVKIKEFANAIAVKFAAFETLFVFTVVRILSSLRTRGERLGNVSRYQLLRDAGRSFHFLLLHLPPLD